MRFVHWSVAILVVADLLNEASANPWHRYFGYAAGALVALRLVWGVFGSQHARLVVIAANAGQVLSYLRSTMSAQGRAYTGHNPLGAWMAFTLWGLTLVVVITGWMLQLDAFWGNESLQTFHGGVAYVLATCVVVHVSGALVTSFVYRTSLIKSMITGNKPDKDS